MPKAPAASRAKSRGAHIARSHRGWRSRAQAATVTGLRMRLVPALLALCLFAVVAHAAPTVAERTAALRALLTAALG
ncbi:MAG TPA: hypothetical protein VGE76_12350, partial [Opitutaceae bacterium]